MSSLDAPHATLLAAVLAAVVAVFAALIAVFNSRGAEVRASQRKLLEDHVPKLAKALHEIIATSEILLKTRSAESRRAWDARGLKAKNALLKCQTEMRYTLWGTTDALKTLSRLPSWAQHAMRHPQKARKIVDCGNALGLAVDHVVLNCLRKGKPPSWWWRLAVWRRKRQLLKAYSQFRATPRAPEK